MEIIAESAPELAPLRATLWEGLRLSSMVPQERGTQVLSDEPVKAECQADFFAPDLTSSIFLSHPRAPANSRTSSSAMNTVSCGPGYDRLRTSLT